MPISRCDRPRALEAVATARTQTWPEANRSFFGRQAVFSPTALNWRLAFEADKNAAKTYHMPRVGQRCRACVRPRPAERASPGGRGNRAYQGARSATRLTHYETKKVPLVGGSGRPGGGRSGVQGSKIATS